MQVSACVDIFRTHRLLQECVTNREKESTRRQLMVIQKRGKILEEDDVVVLGRDAV
jgi:hypothetical protein